MLTGSDYSNIALDLLQAREAVLSKIRGPLNRFSLTEQQWRVIEVLYKHEIMDMKRIATLTCILPPSLTGILDRMERDELVSRIRDIEDNRRVFVQLTPISKRIAEQLHPELNRLYNEVASAIDAEQRIAFSAAIKNLVKLNQAI